MDVCSMGGVDVETKALLRLEDELYFQDISHWNWESNCVRRKVC